MCATEYVEPAAFVSRAEYYQRQRWPLASGFFVGRDEDILWLADEALAEWRQCLAEDICPTDDMLLAYILHRHAHRFERYYGSWATALPNYGAVKHDHDHILCTIARSRGANDHAESRRRLDAVRPYLDFADAVHWARFWDEWYIAHWYLGRLDECRKALDHLVEGAMTDGSKRLQLEKDGGRFIANAAFLQKAANAAIVLHDPVASFDAVQAMLREHGIEGRADIIVPEEFHPLMLSLGTVRCVPRSRFVRDRYAAVVEPRSSAGAADDPTT